MATRTAVSRLADRVDALAARRWQGLTLERIADEAHERMDQLLAEANLQPRSPATGTVASICRMQKSLDG